MALTVNGGLKEIKNRKIGGRKVEGDEKERRKMEEGGGPFLNAVKGKRPSPLAALRLRKALGGALFNLVLLKDPVHFSSVSDRGSTPPRGQSFDLESVLSSTSNGGSTPRGSCNVTSICSTVEKASLLGVPECVFNCEPDGSDGVATKLLSEMMERHGVRG